MGFKKITFFDHHLCHAATAYYGSHFPRKERILVITNDGAGDGLCATVSLGENNSLQRIAKVKSIHSLAGIYSLTTKLLGFKPLEHEYKLMGMAPYSSDMGREIGYNTFRKYVSASKKKPLTFKKNIRGPVRLILPQLEKETKEMRFDWICAGLQKLTEDVLVEWIDNCLRETNTNKIALAGGIFMNVKANKKLMELNRVKDIFIFPSCADETVSIGAAYSAYHKYKGDNLPQLRPINNFYLGQDFSDREVLRQLNQYQKKVKIRWKRMNNIEKAVAHLLAKKQVVARCKGRMEFGARALGNRSILADPSNLLCLREINLMVKKRDFWMPFAPVILKERAGDYIVNKKKVAAPYMILSFDTTKKYGDLIAAVHQADLTARPQIISKEMNPDYYNILKEFEKITGRGVLLNTSFNLHGLPIVCGPKEALEVLRDSGLRHLALGNYMIEKI
jgi:carbamoyltransferase